MVEPTSLQPFVPSGADFDKARQLFRALGFREVWDGGEYVGFACGSARFILQKFDNAEFAGNFMIRLDVPDLDAWWGEVEAMNLPERFPGFRVNPPRQFSWGREVNFIDLAGVCWHVGQG